MKNFKNISLEKIMNISIIVGVLGILMFLIIMFFDISYPDAWFSILSILGLIFVIVGAIGILFSLIAGNILIYKENWKLGLAVTVFLILFFGFKYIIRYVW